MKKLRRLIIMFLISFSLMGLSACQNSDGKLNYEQITAQQAKKIIDSGKDCVIIDARTEEEFNEGHIKDAILIPEYEIKDRAEKEISDKNALILVYCRSGRRSKIASEELVNLGIAEES